MSTHKTLPLRLYMFIGYPGAGKTTVSQFIAACSGAQHIWTDHERSEMFSRPNHSAAESDQLYSYLNSKTETLLRSGTSVIFDTNFNFVADRLYLQKIASSCNAETLIIWLTTDKDTARKRATHDNHRQKNGYQENMSVADFERLSNHIQEPTRGEHYVTIVGQDITQEQVCKLIA
jgi:predicted kinase